MPTVRHLRKAPIKEALVDFRVERLPNVTAESFVDLREALRSDYPHVDDQRGLEAKIEVRGGKLFSTTHDLGFEGLRFTSKDGLTIAQFRADGFTLNRLEPYQNWQELYREAARLWPLYVECAAPKTVVRVALRYINELRLPLEAGEDFALYLATPPQIPDNLPQLVSAFLVRVAFHDREHSLNCNVIQRLEPATGSSPVTVKLDIDVFRADDFHTDLGSLTPVFERLHDFKNRVFFSYLTERTVKLYE